MINLLLLFLFEIYILTKMPRKKYLAYGALGGLILSAMLIESSLQKTKSAYRMSAGCELMPITEIYESLPFSKKAALNFLFPLYLFACAGLGSAYGESIYQAVQRKNRKA
jgi:hypothetical protein